MSINASTTLPPAVRLLLDSDIKLVEYGQNTMRKNGYPQVATRLEYVVSDEQLQFAVDVLEKDGYQRITPDRRLISVDDDFETKGYYYPSTNEVTDSGIPIQLLPSSLVNIPMDDVHTKLPEVGPDRAIYTLSLPLHCISLLRTIIRYPVNSASRVKPEIELLALNAYAIFEYEFYDKDWYRPEESDEEYREKIVYALNKVRSWDLPEEYNFERTVLEAIVDGSMHSRDIPHKRES